MPTYASVCVCLWRQAGEQQVWEHGSVRLVEAPLQILANFTLITFTSP